MSNTRRAFTLIELMVVVAILGVVAAAIGSCLAGGIRAWDAARKFNSGELEAALGLVLLEKDVCGALRFHDIPFTGEPGGMSFPAVIRDSTGETRGDDTDSPAEALGTVRYRLDPNSRAIVRTQWRYPLTEPAIPSGEVIVPRVSAVVLRYFRLPRDVKDDQKRTIATEPGEWLDYWSDSTNLPGGVSIELRFADEHNESLTRTILIPAAERSISGND